MHKVLLGLAILFLPFSSQALELHTGDQVTIPPAFPITEDLYIAAGSISQLATVRGDVFAAGGQVLLQGPVTGDVFATGGSIATIGTTSDDVRIAGGNVTVHGAVLGDLLVFGGNVLVAAPISGDVIAYGGTVRIAAPVTGSVRAGGSVVEIDASITGSVRVDAEQLKLGDQARIAGDLAYSSISKSAHDAKQVIGTVTYTPRANIRESISQGLFAFLSLWFVLKFLMLLVGSLVVGQLFRPYVLDLIGRARAKPLPETALGLAAMIVLPILSVVLLASVIGIPFGLLGLIAFFALGIFAHLIAPIILGSFLHSWLFSTPPTANWKTTSLGAVLFYVIWFMPIVGWLARAFFFFLAVGVIMSFKWDVARTWR